MSFIYSSLALVVCLNGIDAWFCKGVCILHFGKYTYLEDTGYFVCDARVNGRLSITSLINRGPHSVIQFLPRSWVTTSCGASMFWGFICTTSRGTSLSSECSTTEGESSCSRKTPGGIGDLVEAIRVNWSTRKLSFLGICSIWKPKKCFSSFRTSAK